ncbi:MAG TPA: kelch repeat-containing protein, partial [Ferruginibacter sp.]|nr:kelch repeat-containing protein [Ferruginibacter sp.]
TNTWSGDQMNNPGVSLGGSANNKIVFAGGFYYWPLSFANIYDATSQLWSTSLLSRARQVHATTAIGNKIFFAGGEFLNDGLTSNIDIYDASTNAWTVTTFSAPFDQGWAPSGIAVGNKNYWAGGLCFVAATNVNPTEHVEIRDEVTHTSTFACLFQPNYRFGVTSKDNKIIFFTGGGLVKNKFDIYNITTDTWSIGVLNVDIEYAAIISVNNTIYVAGGNLNGAASNQVWKLEF